MAKSNAAKSRTVKWVHFPDNSAELLRAIFPSGSKGLLLTFSDGSKSQKIRNRAIEIGFRRIPNNTALAFKPPSPSYFHADRLAGLLAAEVIDVPREEMESYPRTLDYQQPDLGRGARVTQDPAVTALEEIGRNCLGEKVFRTISGERRKRVTDGGGHAVFVNETADTDPAEYLRAVDQAALPRIAAGLFRMSEQGTVDAEGLRRVAEAACEPASDNDAALQPETAALLLREEFIRQIVESAIADGGSRDSYHRAVKCAENAFGALHSEPETSDGLFPSAGFLIFLRRLTIGEAEIEFSGNERLSIAVPALGSTGNPTCQLLDLTTAVDGGTAERASNALAGRAGEGNSILLVAGSAVGAEAEATRQAIGRAYALEAVAEISQLVASGRHEGAPVTAFFVGERRPAAEASLPRAALRTFRVDANARLDELRTELLRSRRVIAEWHRSLIDGGPGSDPDSEDYVRQQPYVPLSQATAPVTMIPKTLEGATAKALRRVAGALEARGGTDGFVADSVGIPRQSLASKLIAEQVDAVAMRMVAAERQRGFLLADQTGVGKGRTLAAIAKQHLLKGGKVLYFTENAEINIPDVWRDLVAVGADDIAEPCILASRPVRLEVTDSGTDGARRVHRTESSPSRKRIYESGEWPAGKNLVITNYSQFNGAETKPSRSWAALAPDVDTLLILDESHNAINRLSNTGKAIRGMIRNVGRANVVFATATPMRNPSGACLYEPLLPEEKVIDGARIFDGLAGGGETAQECLTSMLAEDGVYLRRDHRLSDIEIQIRRPADARIARYQEVMNRFSSLAECMIEAALKVGGLIGHRHALHYSRMIEQGVDEQTARAQTNLLFQYSSATGSPLAALGRLTINALKAGQVVEETLCELREGRKPLITFHSTNAELFNELAARAGTDAEIELTLRDQIIRVAERVFMVRVDGNRVDARTLDHRVAELSDEIRRRIECLPSDLPASPLDSVIEGLEKHGLRVGEISGRSLAYRGGRIIRRCDNGRKEIVRSYNEGETDVLIFNMAGATGGSYHSSAEFRDQRPRTLIEMETPVDIIKYIQAQGRGNRYGQVARPRILSVVTGLVPELRILQQRNRKLRSLGASIDGDRSHPLLADDVPDFLNRVGDQAVRHVLQANPGLSRKLGFPEFADENPDEDSGFEPRVSGDSGAAYSTSNSLANRVLTRSIALTTGEQTELVELIHLEFKAIVEELESSNSNPLKPREISGEIEIKRTSLFSGTEPRDDDLSRSAFSAPLYISTGIHHHSAEPLGGDELLRLVNQSKITDGVDGFLPFASQIETLIPTEVSPLARGVANVDEALENPQQQPLRFQRRLRRLKGLVYLLSNIRPGRVIQTDNSDGTLDNRARTIVSLRPPQSRSQLRLPQAYSIRTVTPGDSKPEIMTLSRLLRLGVESIRFQDGLDIGRNEMHIRTFLEQSRQKRSFPVQILHGNLLEAISEARRNRLGAMSVFKSESGQTQRGVVVRQSKIDLNHIPVSISSGRVVAALAASVMQNQSKPVTVWHGRVREYPDMTIRMYPENRHAGCRVYVDAARPCSQLRDIFGRHESLLVERRSGFHARFALGRDAVELNGLLSDFDGLQFWTDGLHRHAICDINSQLANGDLPSVYSLV
ncbi:MAG: strawberry notch C-terminal domain-containing protein [Rhodobacteraceae bacterium]|nr:strawberry notch C-terminal domain-containing protein [Paracoccaceae bacterium]